MADTAENLWGYDLLQQWNSQINIPPISKTNCKKRNASERNIKRYYQGQSHSIQTVHKQAPTAVGTFEVLLVLQIYD